MFINYEYELIKEHQKLINLQYKIFENIFKIKRILNKLHYEDRRLRIGSGFRFTIEWGKIFPKGERLFKKTEKSFRSDCFS